jgi:spore photoproduct lyase
VERYYPKKLLVERSAKNFPLTRTIIERLEGVPLEYVQEVTPASLEPVDREHVAGQDTLFLAINRGRFFEPCPGTQKYLCCMYKILNFASNCHLNCTYCILQAYLNNPFMVLYTNTDDMFKELDETFNQSLNSVFRVGTGEYTDSLILDHLTSFSRLIVPYFADKPNCFLELKSKTDSIENLEGLQHRGKTIVSWSLNAESVVRSEEKEACSLASRFRAASQCQQWGYKVGFHFDPLIHHPGWEKGYRSVIEEIFEKIDSASLVWISLGCFRFMPKLKPIITRRFPASKILYQEFVRGLDGKMRYFQPIRIEMYKKMVEWIRMLSPETFIYLCMENQEVWKKSLGYSPRSNRELSGLLDEQCLRKK